MDQGTKTPPRFTMRTMQMDFEAVNRGEIKSKPNPVFFEPTAEVPEPTEQELAEKSAEEVLAETKPELQEQPEKAGPFSFFKKLFSKKEKNVDLEKEELPAYLREMPAAPTPDPGTLMSEPFRPQNSETPRITAEPNEFSRESFGPGLAEVDAPKRSDMFEEPVIPKPETRPIENPEEDRTFILPDEKKLAKNRFILILGVVLLIAALGYGAYSYLNRPQKTTKQPTAIIEEPRLPVEKVKPAALLQYDEEFIIDAGTSEIVATLKDYATLNNTIGATINVYVKNGDNYLPFTEVVKKLSMNPPQNLLDNIESYNLVLFNESTETKRAGFVLKMKDQNTVDKAMLEWENVIALNNDTASLFLGEGYNKPTSTTFKENTYKNVFIRYLNFSDPALTLDYAMFSKQNILILATSKNMAYGLIDRVLINQ